MPFVAIMAALLLYVLLGYLWILLQPQLSRPVSTLAALHRVLFDLPRDSVIGVVRIGILVVAIYLVADSILSALRRRHTSQQKAQRKDEMRAALAAHTPQDNETEHHH